MRKKRSFFKNWGENNTRIPTQFLRNSDDRDNRFSSKLQGFFQSDYGNFRQRQKSWIGGRPTGGGSKRRATACGSYKPPRLTEAAVAGRFARKRELKVRRRRRIRSLAPTAGSLSTKSTRRVNKRFCDVCVRKRAVAITRRLAALRAGRSACFNA